MNHITTANDFLSAGLSFVPVNIQTKRPVVSEWRHWMKSRPTAEEISKHFSSLNGIHGIALIGGTVSGNLEIIDFDNHHGNAKKALSEWSHIPNVKEILDRYVFFFETTQSGGYHVIYRHTATPQGSQKLAMEPNPGCEESQDDKDYDTLIETRGEGGYCIVYPTPGYELKKGSILNLPVISEDERDTLLSYAATLNRKPVKVEKRLKLTNKSIDQMISTGKPNNIFEAFNNDPANVSAVLSLLQQHGYKFSHESRGNQYFIRPGKKKGISLSFNGSIFYAFSSNAAPFPHMQGVNLFTAFALLAHDGNVKAAVAELRKDPRYQQERARVEVVKLSDTVVTAEGKIETVDFFVQTDFTKDPPKKTIRYDLFIRFLTTAGFRKFREGDALQFVRIQNNLVRLVEIEEIQSFVLDMIRNQVDEETLSFVIGSDKLFTVARLSYLPMLPDQFNESTKDKVWYYFSNIALAVTKDGFTPVAYSDLEYPVWEKQVGKFEFKESILNRSGGEWELFLKRVTEFDKDPRLFFKLLGALGYLLTPYKQHSLAKAVILIDAKIPTISYDANGGTGKSLIGKWLSQYRNSCIIDGRKLNNKNNLQFLFQGVNPDTQIVFIDDADPHFDFQMLFSSITSDMTIRKMYQGEFVIPFSKSPKFLSTTNHSIRGTDDSTNRRKYEIGIGDYYGADRSPRDEFGHDLIYDWNEIEWECSHKIMLQAIQYYLIHGLIMEELDINQTLKKAISETSLDFVNFMLEQIYYEKIRDSAEWNRKEKFQEFISQFDDVPDYKTLQLRSFTNWIEKFCRVFKLRHAERRSNSINLSKIYGGILKKVPPEMIKNHLKIDDNALKAAQGGIDVPF